MIDLPKLLLGRGGRTAPIWHILPRFHVLPLQVVQHTTCSRALPGVDLPPVGERQAALYGALRCFSRSWNRPRHCVPHVFSTFGYDRNLSVVQPHGRFFACLPAPAPATSDVPDGAGCCCSCCSCCSCCCCDGDGTSAAPACGGWPAQIFGCGFKYASITAKHRLRGGVLVSVWENRNLKSKKYFVLDYNTI